MGVVIALVHGQAEGYAGVRTGPLAVVGDGQTQGRRRFRPVPDGHVLNSAGLGNIGRNDQGVRSPVQMVDRQRSAQSAFFRIIVGRRPGSAVKPVHCCRPGPGSAEHVVCCRVQEGTGLVPGSLFPQLQVRAADDGRRFAVHFVPGHAGRRRSIEGGLGRVIVGRLYRLVFPKIPVFDHSAIAKGFIYFGKRIAYHIFRRVSQLIPKVVSLFIPVGEKIKPGMAFRCFRALDAYGVQGAAAVPRNGDILGGHRSFFRPGRGFSPHGSGELFRRKGKIPVHLPDLALG